MKNSSSNEFTNQAGKKTKKTVLRVSYQIKESIELTLEKINLKPYGKKVKSETLIAKLLNKITEKDISELQENSLTGVNRLEKSYDEYCEKFGRISKDNYYLLLLKSKDRETKSETILAK